MHKGDRTCATSSAASSNPNIRHLIDTRAKNVKLVYVKPINVTMYKIPLRSSGVMRAQRAPSCATTATAMSK